MGTLFLVGTNDYEGWTLRTGNENKTARESLSEKGTISTPMLTKEEYEELFKLIKEETSNHQGHYVIITTTGSGE